MPAAEVAARAAAAAGRVGRLAAAARPAAEKGFSLGFFDEAYLGGSRSPSSSATAAIQAFANVWPGAERDELSIDLMRYLGDGAQGRDGGAAGPPDALGQGARAIAVLAGHGAALGRSRRRRWRRSWNRLGAFLYEHGEAVYSFQGLRAFKEKFDPVWEPRYLAYPGGLRLPRILADSPR